MWKNRNLYIPPGLLFESEPRPQYDEQQKLTRLRCRLLEDLTKEGWVTMKGNQGADLVWVWPEMQGGLKQIPIDLNRFEKDTDEKVEYSLEH